MKKIIVLLLVLTTCVMTFAACTSPAESGGESSETESETKAPLELEDTDYNADCIKRKGKRLVIVLPESKHILPVRNSDVKYLSKVSDELVSAAEKKITASVTAMGEKPDWVLEVNEDGELCLRAEVIKFIEDAEGEGCGIDHEHIVFEEPISAVE